MVTHEQDGNGHVLDQEAFARHIEAQLAGLPDIVVVNRTGMELTLRRHSTDMRLNLGNFYDAYMQTPVQLDAIVQTISKTVQGFHPDRSAHSFDELRERIFPMLKPVALLKNVKLRQLPMLAYHTFLEDLIITYVIDEPDSVAFINEQHLEHWQIGAHELHAQALQNLRMRTLNTTDYTTVGSGPQRLFIFNSQDGYDATRILLADLLDQWRTQLPGRMVIGIPNRDFLIAFSDADRTIFANVAQQIERDAVQQAHGLTSQLFMLFNGEIRVYDTE